MDDEPQWHAIFYHAKKNLFTGEFETPFAAVAAGDEGLRDLITASILIDGLSIPERQKAKASLQDHVKGQKCAFCKAANH